MPIIIIDLVSVKLLVMYVNLLKTIRNYPIIYAGFIL